MSSSISERVAIIRSTLPQGVKLIAVTKKVPSDKIRLAYEAGIRDFAESRIQEAMGKRADLEDLSDITWHFIGHVQSNKAKKIISNFQWIHSLDSLKLAQRLDRLASELEINPLVCLQVKILPDPNKSGWNIDELRGDLPALALCKRLQFQGLMTIPPLGLNDLEILDVFKRTKELATEIRDRNWQNFKMSDLSMGMSGDYKIALQADTTMVRLGTILFGERPL
ncbi:YggS family pyridoxal phosphate-dependent enzyme [Mastigocoleus sp. MO_188.B34]|uniref:YggS family pyridoxal phosphate-dependent enzyme n=1 Tax=Mastigocoleus sp. MO_188.B34 TaxID=3036635 RepID=UPI002601E79C|nr:YggS family pyridoxal phosphate-dependent enzyme [Mastigocoleus sp. MO_188.B34]MDJ0694099.1 YggS family pyridoxal phosphate-dependent enzyme [Mastigocoleus sp. MO_188.B34]